MASRVLILDMSFAGRWETAAFRSAGCETAGIAERTDPVVRDITHALQTNVVAAHPAFHEGALYQQITGIVPAEGTCAHVSDR